MQPPHPSTAVRRFHPRARRTWTANVRHATSWVAAGSVATVLALIGLAAHETPAHSTTGTTPGGTPTTGTAGVPSGTATSVTPTAGGSSGSFTSGAPSTSGSILSPSTGGSAHVATGLS